MIGLFIFFSPYTDHLMNINGSLTFIQVRKDAPGWAKGLSGRKEICNQCGMLFLFPEEEEQIFWMKDMQFDIDIIWVRKGKIVQINHHVSHKTPLKKIKSMQPVDRVLELPAGRAHFLGLRSGDELF